MSMDDLDDLEGLANELAEFAPPERQTGRTAQEERVIAGFEQIQRFVTQHGRAPQHGEERDIFERLYAMRLERLRGLTEFHDLLAPLDTQGLLSADSTDTTLDAAIDLDELAAELAGDSDGQDITVLRHVRSSSEKRAADAIADRKACEDFEQFKPLFEQIRRDLQAKVRLTRPFGKNAAIAVGHWFVLDGQTAYVAEEGEEFDSPQGRKDARLRVIFSNGTESNLLRLSLVRALYKDEAARRITEPDLGPLFGDVLEEDDQESGTIYVLQSLSDHPYIAQHRELIHKIGVTGGPVQERIANAEHETTYLRAKVEVVASYKLFGINRSRLERQFHKLFAHARLDVTLHDRLGYPVQPDEWFMVPLPVIDEAVDRIKDGSITQYIYDKAALKLRKA